MKRILVPTDLEETAEKGLQLAVEVAKRTRAEIFLINFQKHPAGQSFATSGEVRRQDIDEEQRFTLALLQANTARLNALSAQYGREGVIIHTEIVDRNFTEGVGEIMDQYGIDLVIMGTTGEEDFKEQFTGNHTERVIRVSSCPVISVRDDFDLRQFSDIVLAMDVLGDEDPYSGLQSLKELADIFDATVHIVHVKDPGSPATKELAAYFAQVGEQIRFRSFDFTALSSSDEANAVIDYARKINAGLVAVLKNSDDGVFRIFSNRFSDRLVKEMGRPVFTYNLQPA